MNGKAWCWLALVLVLALAACAGHVELRPKGQSLTGISVGGQGG